MAIPHDFCLQTQTLGSPYENLFYYINANEILGELSRENLISSHVKISPLLWLHNKSRLSHQKTIKVKWFGIYYMAAWRDEISLLVLKKYFTSERSE